MPTRSRQGDAVLEPVLRSAAMKRVDSVLRTVASKDVTVTLTGESGVGKEVLARRIHDLSKRRHGPFVPINCAAIPDALFESELFGHERGAFTGATERAKGKIEAAEGGTLLLDEIGEMPLGMQVKLLRFLENRRFMRVGGVMKLHANVRFIFATLRPLDREVSAGRFRADLYYRIQGISLHVPPLRDRTADIEPLVRRFIAQISSQHGTLPPRFSRRARATLLAYGWPGNVRELRNTIELMCLLREGRQVRLRDLPEALQRLGPPSGSGVADGTMLRVSLDASLEQIIESIFDAALALEQGNRARAAERLGISVRTIQRHIARGAAR